MNKDLDQLVNQVLFELWDTDPTKVPTNKAIPKTKNKLLSLVLKALPEYRLSKHDFDKLSKNSKLLKQEYIDMGYNRALSEAEANIRRVLG